MLETEMTEFVRRTYEMYPPDTATMTIAEQRTLYDSYAKTFTPALPDGLTIETTALDSVAGHRIPLRLYRKTNGMGQAGTVLYFHGGGYVLGSLDSHEAITARLAADTGMYVVAVDYRLAPEHPAPAAHEDCIEVTLAAINGTLPFAGVPAKLQLVGDSAGGNLAAALLPYFVTGVLPGFRVSWRSIPHSDANRSCPRAILRLTRRCSRLPTSMRTANCIGRTGSLIRR
jgi:acetyl esterase